MQAQRTWGQYFKGWLDWLRSLFFKREMELSLVGLNKGGKSTLVQVLTTGTFTEDMIPTVGFNMRKLTKGGVTIKMWDLGGQQRFRSLWERYCRGVQAIVFVVDSADADSVPSAARELHSLLEKPSLKGIPLLVLGNKNDLPGAMGVPQLTAAMNLRALPDREVAVYSISCKNHSNIDRTLEWLTKHAKS
ncbi:hypothetical protein HYH03_008450 [Edaphochlamys debaryana]|uniref:Uncharacterized protein n=1 Tax=Edaphochlamys debaryana TaxID=47281 RepID=A0A836BY85_9CHLO|nr:hypothetical protein HYH03_008450 [Edaphochlamys debaryana]|eukprot:KAG2493315.1 hypothetical protein HYH03_008450 [Edaphochlamys debaryana]